MERMSTRTFRESFSRLTEPVEVLKGVETIGFYYPGARNPTLGVLGGDEAYQLIPGKVSSEMPTMRPGQAPRSVTAPPAQERFNTRPFTAVPKKTK